MKLYSKFLGKSLPTIKKAINSIKSEYNKSNKNIVIVELGKYSIPFLTDNGHVISDSGYQTLLKKK